MGTLINRASSDNLRVQTQSMSKMSTPTSFNQELVNTNANINEETITTPEATIEEVDFSNIINSKGEDLLPSSSTEVDKVNSTKFNSSQTSDINQTQTQASNNNQNSFTQGTNNDLPNENTESSTTPGVNANAARTNTSHSINNETKNSSNSYDTDTNQNNTTTKTSSGKSNRANSYNTTTNSSDNNNTSNDNKTSNNNTRNTGNNAVGGSTNSKSSIKGNNTSSSNVAAAINSTTKEVANVMKVNAKLVYQNTARYLQTTLRVEDYDPEIQEFINQLRQYGLYDYDINRILTGEITLEELLNEIESDPFRMRKVYEAGMLHNPDLQLNKEFNSLDELKNYIEELTAKHQKLLEEYNLLSNNKPNSFLSILEKMEKGMSLEKAAKLSIAYWVDKDGNKYYTNPISDPKNPKAKDYKVVKVYDSEYYKELEQALNSGKSIEDLKKKYTKESKERANALKEKEQEIKEIVAEISKCEYIHEQININVEHQVKHIDPYIYAEDFDKNKDFDSKCLNTLKQIEDSYITKNGSVTVSDEDLADVLACIINGNKEDFKNMTFTSDDNLVEHFKEWAPNMTDEEREIFNYIYNTKGKDAAVDYAKEITDTMDNRWLQIKTATDSEKATSSLKNKVLTSVGSVLITPAEGMKAVCYSMNSWYQEVIRKEDTKIRRTDVYSMGNTWRSAVSQNIAENQGETWAFWYDTGMSMADSATLIGINVLTGGTATPALSAALMGSRAYVSTLNDSLDKGLSDGQAVALAWGSAAAETVFESYSAGHLFNLEGKLGITTEKFVEKIGSKISNPVISERAAKLAYHIAGSISQGLAEGEEEFGTEIANYVLDRFISKDLSDYSKSMDYYLKLGYTIDQAEEKTLKDMTSRLEQAFVGGFASGIFFGFAGTTKASRRASYGIANNMYEDLQGNTKGAQFADAIRKNRIQLEQYQAALEKQDKLQKLAEKGIAEGKTLEDLQLTDEEIDLLLNGTTGMKIDEARKLSRQAKIKSIENKLKDNSGKISLFKRKNKNSNETKTPKQPTTPIIDPVHGYQLTSDKLTSNIGQDALNALNREGYMSQNLGKYLEELFEDSNYDIYRKTIDSSQLESIFNQGIHCLGYRGGTAGNFPVSKLEEILQDAESKGIKYSFEQIQSIAESLKPKKTAEDVSLNATIARTYDMYDMINILKNSNGRSEGSNHINGTLIIKIPKGLKQSDILYEYEPEHFAIKPEFIEGFVGCDENGNLTEMQYRIQNHEVEEASSNIKIPDNSIAYEQIDQIIKLMSEKHPDINNFGRDQLAAYLLTGDISFVSKEYQNIVETIPKSTIWLYYQDGGMDNVLENVQKRLPQQKNTKENQNKEKTSEFDYEKYRDTNSDYTLEQLMSSDYRKLCDKMFELAPTEEAKQVLEDILYRGKAMDFDFISELPHRNNPRFESQRRASMAELYLKDPETFKYLCENKINLFHGTSAVALESILDNGLTSLAESQKNNIEVTTGEEWSRIKGIPRSFVSLADILDISKEYAESFLDNQNDLSFPIIIATTSEEGLKYDSITVSSDISEIGIKGKLNAESIKVLMVPEAKVDLVKNMVGDKNIKVLPMDFESSNLYYFDYSFELNNSAFNKLKDIINSKNSNDYNINTPNLNDLSTLDMSKNQSPGISNGKFQSIKEAAKNKLKDTSGKVDIFRKKESSNLNNNQVDIIDQSKAIIIDVSTLDMSESKEDMLSKEKSINLNRSYEGYDYVVEPKTSLAEVLDNIKDITDKKILIELNGIEELNPSLFENIPDNISFRISNYNDIYAKTDSFLYTLNHLTYNAEELKAISSKLNEIKSRIDDNLTDYEKAEYVYNYLKDNIKYNSNPGGTVSRSKEFDGLNSLIVGESTCQGFAHTYRMILNSLGIECEEVWGKLNGKTKVGEHAYTVVKTGDDIFVVDPVRELLTNHPGTGFGVSFETLKNEYSYKTNNELMKKLNFENKTQKTNSNQALIDKLLNLDEEQFIEYIENNDNSIYDSNEIVERLINYLSKQRAYSQLKLLKRVKINSQLYDYMINNQEIINELNNAIKEGWYYSIENIMKQIEGENIVDFLNQINLEGIGTSERLEELKAINDNISEELQTKIILKLDLIANSTKLTSYDFNRLLGIIKNQKILHEMLTNEDIIKYMTLNEGYNGVRLLYSATQYLDPKYQEEYIMNNELLTREAYVSEIVYLVTTTKGNATEMIIQKYPKVIEKLDCEDLMVVYLNTQNSKYLDILKTRLTEMTKIPNDGLYSLRKVIIENNSLNSFSQEELNIIFKNDSVSISSLLDNYKQATNDSYKDYLKETIIEKLQETDSITLYELRNLMPILDDNDKIEAMKKLEPIEKLGFRNSTIIEIMEEATTEQKNILLKKINSIDGDHFKKLTKVLDNEQIVEAIEKLTSISISDIVNNQYTTLSDDQINKMLEKATISELLTYIYDEKIYSTLLHKLQENPNQSINAETGILGSYDETVKERIKEISKLLDNKNKLRLIDGGILQDEEFANEIISILKNNPSLISEISWLHITKIIEIYPQEEINNLYKEIDIQTIFKAYTTSLSLDENIKKEFRNILLEKQKSLDLYKLIQIFKMSDENNQLEIINKINKISISNASMYLKQMINEAKSDEIVKQLLNKVNIVERFDNPLNLISSLDNQTAELFIENCNNEILLKLYAKTSGREYETEIMKRFAENQELFINLDMDDLNQVFDNLSNDNKEQIVSQINTFYDNITNERIKELYDNPTTAEKYRLFAYIKGGNILTEEQLSFLEQLKEKNQFVLSTFNYSLFDPAIYKLDKKLLIKLSKYYSIGSKIKELSADHAKFNLFINLIENDNSTSSIVTDNKMALVLEYLSENDIEEKFTNATTPREIETVRNIILKEIDILSKTDIERKNQNINRSLITPENFTLDNYQKELFKTCDELFERATTEEEMKNILFNKYFSISIEDAEEIYRMYGSRFDDSLLKYDEAGIATKYIQTIDNILNAKSTEELKDIYYNVFSTENTSYNMDDTLTIINEIKKIYTRSLKETLFNPTEITGYVEYNGQKLPVYEPSGDFQMIIQSTYAYGGGMPMINDNYFDSWNLSSRTQNHGICCSVISNTNMGMARVQEHGVVIGFNSFSDEQINMMAPYDIFTANDGYIITSGRQLQFLPASEISNETRHTHNEFNLERSNLTGEGNLANIQPDYVIVFEEMEDYQKQNAYKASVEFNIPLVYIDKTKLAQKESAKIDNLITEYNNTKNVELIRDIIVLHENNTSGYGNPTDQHLIKEYFKTERISDLLESAIENTTNKEDLLSLKAYIQDEVRKFAKEDPNKERSHKLDLDANGLIEKIDDKLNSNTKEE